MSKGKSSSSRRPLLSWTLFVSLGITMSAIVAVADARRRNDDSTSAQLPAGGNPKAVAATIQGRIITVDDVDQAGGQPITEALDKLYETRIAALWELVSKDVLAREAVLRRVDVAILLKREVDDKVSAVPTNQIDALLLEGSPDRLTDPRRRREAEQFLLARQRAQRHRAYVNGLIERYGVKVNFLPPPPAPPEVIRGPERPIIGAPDAPVKLVVWSDYLCPYCAHLQTTLGQLHERFPKDLAIIYRSFPVHVDAGLLAESSLCADEQDRFITIHPMLFQSTSLGMDGVTHLATQTDLDLTKFNDCLTSHRMRSRLDADVAEAQRLKVQGTPTLFLQGVRIRGAQSFEQLSSRIDAALKNRLSPVSTTR